VLLLVVSWVEILVPLWLFFDDNRVVNEPFNREHACSLQNNKFAVLCDHFHGESFVGPDPCKIASFLCLFDCVRGERV